MLECPPGQAQAPPETPDVPVNREFQDLLVALSPSDTNWAAVDLAISIATLEDARLDGLCLVPVRTAPLALTGETEALAGSLVRSLQEATTVVRATPGPDTFPQSLEVGAKVTLDERDEVPTIVSSALTVKARIEGVEPDRFSAVVDEAAKLCPVSRLFAGAEITVDATLADE